MGQVDVSEVDDRPRKKKRKTHAEVHPSEPPRLAVVGRSGDRWYGPRWELWVEVMGFFGVVFED